MFNDRTVKIMKRIAKNAPETDDTTEAQEAWARGAKDAANLLKE